MAKRVQHTTKEHSVLPDDLMFTVNPKLKPLASSHPVIEQKREEFKAYATNKVDETNLEKDWTLDSDLESIVLKLNELNAPYDAALADTNNSMNGMNSLYKSANELFGLEEKQMLERGKKQRTRTIKLLVTAIATLAHGVLNVFSGLLESVPHRKR